MKANGDHAVMENMSGNPFEDLMYYSANENIRSLLFEASVLWDTLTDDGKNPDDTSLYMVLNSYELNDVLFKYEFFRSGDSFDKKALYEALENWICENNI